MLLGTWVNGMKWLGKQDQLFYASLGPYNCNHASKPLALHLCLVCSHKTHSLGIALVANQCRLWISQLLLGDQPDVACFNRCNGKSGATLAVCLQVRGRHEQQAVAGQLSRGFPDSCPGCAKGALASSQRCLTHFTYSNNISDSFIVMHIRQHLCCCMVTSSVHPIDEPSPDAHKS